MSVLLSDNQIQELIDEEKVVNFPLLHLASNFKNKRGHRECDHSIKRDDGSAFKIIIRQSLHNPLDFSAILGYLPVGSNEVFLLRRYNGKSHLHSNKIEKESPFYDFHIHTATERYQMQGLREEYYAQVTQRYADLSGAIDCLVADCNIVSNNPQQPLFN